MSYWSSFCARPHRVKSGRESIIVFGIIRRIRGKPQ